MLKKTVNLLAAFAVAVSGSMSVAAVAEAQGADEINRRNEDGLAPLHFAVADLHPERVEELLAGGADPNLLALPVNEAAHAPINIAALALGVQPLPFHHFRVQNFIRVARALIYAGADPESRESPQGMNIYELLESQNQPPEVVEAVRQAVADRERGAPMRLPPVRRNLAEMIRAGEPPHSIHSALEGGADVSAVDDRGFPPLHLAILSESRESLETVALLLTFGADPNQADSEGNTALHHAAARGDLNIARALLAFGAERFAVNNAGQTPPDVQAPGENRFALGVLLRDDADKIVDEQCGRSRLHLAVFERDVPRVRTLLELGASLEIDSRCDGRPLHVVADWIGLADEDLEIAELLLEAGADPNGIADSRNNETPLHHAVRGAHPELVELLLRFGASMDIENFFGETPDELEIGAAGGANIPERRARTIALLEAARGRSINVTAGRGGDEDELRPQTGGGGLRAGGEEEETETDWNAPGPNGGLPPLHYAAAGGDLEQIEWLVERGADVNLRFEGRMTPLLLAAGGGHAEAARLLLRLGADPFAADGAGWTFLHIGIITSAEEIIRLAVEVGLDPAEGPDAGGDYPIHMAMRAQYPLRVVRALEPARLDWNVENGDGERPAHMAIRHPRVSEELVRHMRDRGADFFQPDRRGERAVDIARADGLLNIARLLVGGDSPENSEAALFEAIRAGDVAAVSGIMRSGEIPPDLADEDGVPMLFAAWQAGHPEVALELLALGADPNAFYRGGSLAHYMAVNGVTGPGVAPHMPWRDVLRQMEALARAGIDLNARDNKGHPPLNYLPWRHDEGVAADNDSDREAILELADYMRGEGARCVAHGGVNVRHRICASEGR